ncbi:85/88 kDa calcium-independent phospholipase A2-like isoform X2 [Lineus longissimus]
MSFFNKIFDGVGEMLKNVTSSTTPYTVDDVKSQQFERCEVVCSEDCLKLYRMRGAQLEAVLYPPSPGPIVFSLFRLTDMNAAMQLFRIYTGKLLPLIVADRNLVKKKTLQEMGDTLREHPTWLCAHVAAHLGLMDCFRHNLILQQINSQDSQLLVTPLQVAIQAGKFACVQELLTLNARLDIADAKGNNVFHYAASTEPRILEFLAAKNKNMLNQLNMYGESALHMACSNGKPECVQVLLKWGADPKLNASERFPIHCALKTNNVRCVETLLSWNRQTIEVQDLTYGGPPLHWARSRQAVNLLVEKKCNIEAKNRFGDTALNIMVAKGRLECVLALLIKEANTDFPGKNGNAPIHNAIATDNLDMVKALIVFGGEINAINERGEMPRHLAATSKEKNRDFILHILHCVGASRCSPDMRGCNDGCSAKGGFNGKPIGKSYLPNDVRKQLYDDMIGAAAIAAALCKGKMASSDAIGLDMVDASTAEGLKILCLDGGGIRGLVLIQLLLALEKKIGRPIKDCFDWVAGTSTGGILALGIVHGKSLRHLQGLYFNMKDEVFIGSRPYESEPLERVLRKEFGEHTKMCEVQYPRVCVTGVLGDRHPAELHLFRNYEPPLLPVFKHVDVRENPNGPKFDPPPLPKDQLVWRAARCSGAAPTYFRACGRFLDGGLIGNNPTLDLMTEIHECNVAAHSKGSPHLARPIGCVVSLGTGRVPVHEVKAIDVFRPGGIIDVARTAIGASNLGNLLVDQVTNAEDRPVDRARAWCGMLNIPYFRFSPQLTQDISLDEKNTSVLLGMLWETQIYIYNNRDGMSQLAEILKH